MQSYATMYLEVGWLDCRTYFRICTISNDISNSCFRVRIRNKLECGPMPNVMVAVPNIGSALCSTPCTIRLPRRETRWNLQGYPKLPNRSQPLVGRSSPYSEDIWGKHCCLTSFIPIVDTCLSCEDTARHSCAMVPSRVQYISDMHSKFALRPHHVWKYGGHPVCNCWD